MSEKVELTQAESLLVEMQELFQEHAYASVMNRINRLEHFLQATVSLLIDGDDNVKGLVEQQIRIHALEVDATLTDLQGQLDSQKPGARKFIVPAIEELPEERD